MKKLMVLDAGALIAVEKSPRGRVYSMCETAMKSGEPALLLTVVLAQVWRAGGRQAGLAALRKLCIAVPFEEEDAKDVGRLLSKTGGCDVVDAAVVNAAIQNSATVVTSDPRDIHKLVHAAGAHDMEVITV